MLTESHLGQHEKPQQPSPVVEAVQIAREEVIVLSRGDIAIINNHILVYQAGDTPERASKKGALLEIKQFEYVSGRLLDDTFFSLLSDELVAFAALSEKEQLQERKRIIQRRTLEKELGIRLEGKNQTTHPLVPLRDALLSAYRAEKQIHQGIQTEFATGIEKQIRLLGETSEEVKRRFVQMGKKTESYADIAANVAIAGLPMVPSRNANLLLYHLQVGMDLAGLRGSTYWQNAKAEWVPTGLKGFFVTVRLERPSKIDSWYRVEVRMFPEIIKELIEEERRMPLPSFEK